MKCIIFRAKFAPVSITGLGYSCNFGLAVIFCIILISLLTPENVYFFKVHSLKWLSFRKKKIAHDASIYLRSNMNQNITSIISNSIHCDREKVHLRT